jgi:hemerythrin-like domain-containing protein
MIKIGAAPATIDSPVEHLVACHRRIEQRLDTLVNAAAHLESDRATALEAIRRSIQFLDTSGALHTRDEEASLFPRLRPKLTAAETEFVDSLEAQHVGAESIFAELKRLAESPLEDSGFVARYHESAIRLRSLYRDHIQAEDEILTVLAKRLLSGAELGEISKEMRERRAG